MSKPPKPRFRSVWVFHVDASACNGCDIEVLDVLTPFYDVERFGVKLVPTPRQADALLVSGSVNRQAVIGLKRVYEAMPPKPRIVAAIGACAIAGGIFYDSLAVYGGVDKILPVHIYIPGCPPRPEAILFGLGQLLGLVNQKIAPRTIYATMGVRDRVYGVLFNERLYKDLRYYLTRYVGYYDREYILEDMLKIINSAKTLAELREKIIDRASKIRDPRLREIYSIAGGFILEKIREEIRTVQTKR